MSLVRSNQKAGTIRSAILNSANDRGPPGVDPFYGHGGITLPERSGCCRWNAFLPVRPQRLRRLDGQRSPRRTDSGDETDDAHEYRNRRQHERATTCGRATGRRAVEQRREADPDSNADRDLAHRA